MYLHMTSIRPSPAADAKLGASADTSHLYCPDDFNVTGCKNTLLSSDFESCKFEKFYTNAY